MAETLEDLIDKATDPSKSREGVDYTTPVCDRINLELDGPLIGIRYIATKVKSAREEEAILGLNLIEACVQNCGQRFHAEVGKYRFLNELIKLISSKVKTMRQKRLTQEPAGDCFCIKVLLEDDREIKRNFPQNGTYQEVYDWVGQETSDEYFSLHEFRSGFFSDAKLHSNTLLQSETLCLLTRKKDEATEIFVKDDEVSFYGNFDPNQSLDATIPDENNKDHGEQRDKIEEDKIPSEEPEKKKKKKTWKRRKKKQIGSLQEGDEKICKSAEVANESKN